MTRFRLVVAGAVVLAAMGVATAVQASVPDGAGVVHGCYVKAAPPGGQPGALRVIDTALGQTCQVSEGAVNWSQTGPQGPQGLPGPPGPKGDPGANAYFAGTGLNLSGGSTFNIQKSFQLPQGCGLNQAPYQTAVPSTWGCFTAANAGESCSGGKFQNGVDANGDITCATPATGSSGSELWSTTYSPSDAPQGSDVTLATLSLPAGTFLVQGTGTGADDPDGNDNVDMSCQINPGSGVFERLTADSGDTASVPFHVMDTISLGAAGNVSLVCHDLGGSDHVLGGEMTALKIGTAH